MFCFVLFFNENVTEITRGSLAILTNNTEAALDTLAGIPQWTPWPGFPSGHLGRDSPVESSIF